MTSCETRLCCSSTIKMANKKRPVADDDEVSIIERWQENPVAFVHECLGVDGISNQQEEGLKLVGDMATAKLMSSLGVKLNKEQKRLASKTGISIRAGQGVGKDTWLSWVYLWLLFCFSSTSETAGGMVTAPSSSVLYDALWREIRTWVERSKINGYDISTHIDVIRDRVFVKSQKGVCEVVGRTVAVSAGAEEAAALGGRHWMYHINAVDEASGVNDAVFKPIEGSLTEKIAFAIYISNPTQASGHFYKTHTEYAKFYECRQWDATKSTINNFVPGMNAKIAREIEQYGADSNYVKVRIYGDFPDSDDDSLIPLHWVHSAIGRDISLGASTMPGLAGLDVARFGNDDSCLVVRDRKIITHIESWHGFNLMQTCGRAKEAYDKGLFSMVAVDSIGVGAGVVDRLSELGVPVIGVNVSEMSPYRERFERLRDDLWWRAREFFESLDCSIDPKIDKAELDGLVGELTTIRYRLTSAGKLHAESKDEMKKRGLVSPNRADAFNLSLFLTGMGASSGWQPKRKR
jgi:phage terminase large subunit